ncbi:hypothetical protein H0X06_06335 [Candidatus Dependentiae bacterium]|nr:hypothetical protein [Candidatus Dependentiae bacterium]
MKMYRILAIVRRHSLLTFRRFDRILNIVYWPFLNIVLWGVTSEWMQQQSSLPLIVPMILSGLVLWQIVFRVNLETAKGLLEELLNHNVVNIFSTPLTLFEWVLGTMILGAINMVLVMSTCSLALWLFYGINIFALGWSIIPFMISLLISGWSIGFLICGFLINWGLKAQDFVFTIGWLFAPFSAIYYPISVLPSIGRTIGRFLPMSYVFESMRSLLETGTFPPRFMMISFFLNFLYFSLSLFFFWSMFEHSKTKGLARLDG